MALPTDPSKLILTDADIQRAGALKAALDGKAPASRFQSGTGSPEGVLAAPPGTEYVDTAGTLGAWKWMKKTGTGTTGWVVIEGKSPATGLESTFHPSVSGYAKVLRTNDVVQMAISASFIAPFPSGSNLFTVPLGFRPRLPQNTSPPYADSGPLAVSSVAKLWVAKTGGTLSWSLTYVTDDPWPTS